MAVRMVVAGLVIDPVSKVPIVILKERDGERAFPIWIGLMEASAIAARLEGVDLPRPLTHDMLLTVIHTLGGKVERIVVSELRGNTFFASIHISSGDATVEIDARPSDAIALALRADAAIFAEEQVFAHAHELRITKADAVEAVLASGAVETGQAGGREPSATDARSGPQPLDPNTPPEQWTDILENLDPEAFGKYKM